MIAYSQTAQGTIRARHPVAPVYSVTVVQSVPDAGSSTPAIDEDANILNLTGATLLNEAWITADVFADFSFESLDTAIAAVDSEGNVSRVSNGTARITVSVGPNKQKLRVPVSLVDPAETVVLSSWVSGTLAKFSHDTIADATDGATPSTDRAIFSGSVRNPSLFAPLAWKR